MDEDFGTFVTNQVEHDATVENHVIESLEKMDDWESELDPNTSENLLNLQTGDWKKIKDAKAFSKYVKLDSRPG